MITLDIDMTSVDMLRLLLRATNLQYCNLLLTHIMNLTQHRYLVIYSLFARILLAQPCKQCEPTIECLTHILIPLHSVPFTLRTVH